MRSNYSAIGKFVVYIKSIKDEARGEALLAKALNGKAKLIDKYVETSVRKNYKPELEKAIEKCNEKGATLIIPNIGHLPRSIAFCNACIKLDGNDPYICAIRETNGYADVFKYYATQMFLQCMDTMDLYKSKAKKGIAKKKATGWIPGNTVNLTTLAKSNASKARVEQANEYCREIIPVIREIQRYGKVTLQGIADALMARNIKTRRGKAEWTPMGVSNLLKKAEKLRI
jgi:hypothetical protein